MIVRRPVTRFAAQRRRCASTGTHKDGDNTTNNRLEVHFTIDDRGHEVWGSRNSQLPKRIALLRFAHVPESMVDVLAAIREIERNFGRIRNYRLLRDADRPSEYQAIVWTAFESPQSLRLIPTTGITLKIPVPAQEKLQGGPGLSDILCLLEPQDRGRLDRPTTSPVQGTEGGKPDGSHRVIDVEVRPTDDHEIRYRNTARPPIRSRAMKAAIGHAFLDWGGFAPLQPLFETSPFTSLSQAPKAQESNMRLALNKWSQILDRPDPSFPEMLAKRGAEATKEPPPSSRFIDKVTNAMGSSAGQQGAPQSKITPSEDNWEFLKDYKVKPKRKPMKSTSPPKLDTPPQPKKATLLDKAREAAREQAREQLLRQKSELDVAQSSASLKESFERTLKPRTEEEKPSSLVNKKAMSTGGGKGKAATTEESGGKGFWSWF